MTLRLTILFALFYSATFAQSDYMANELQPIKENFKRINEITNWTTIEKKELWDTTEGGEVSYYYQQDSILKFVVRQFGETRQSIHKFYLFDDQLSVSYYKEIVYNRPITWDSTAMLESDDNQVHNFDKSEIEEERSYFSKGKLIRQINSQDCGSPFSEEYLNEEHIRLIALFNYYLEIVTNKTKD